MSSPPKGRVLDRTLDNNPGTLQARTPEKGENRMRSITLKEVLEMKHDEPPKPLTEAELARREELNAVAVLESRKLSA